MAEDIKLLGGQRELFPKHQFLVRSRLWSAAFQTCSELSKEIAKIEYWEGGSIIPWKVPGRTTYTDITLERGASTSRAFYDYAVKVSNEAGGAYQFTRGEGENIDYREDLTIEQLDRDSRTIKRAWLVKNSFPVKFVAGDWDNTADEVVIESMTFTLDYFKLKQ